MASQIEDSLLHMNAMLCVHEAVIEVILYTLSETPGIDFEDVKRRIRTVIPELHRMPHPRSEIEERHLVIAQENALHLLDNLAKWRKVDSAN